MHMLPNLFGPQAPDGRRRHRITSRDRFGPAGRPGGIGPPGATVIRAAEHQLWIAIAKMWMLAFDGRVTETTCLPAVNGIEL